MAATITARRRKPWEQSEIEAPSTYCLHFSLTVSLKNEQSQKKFNAKGCDGWVWEKCDFTESYSGINCKYMVEFIWASNLTVNFVNNFNGNDI